MAEQRINLNAATTEELMQLPGIGSVLAQRIVTYRDTVRFFEQPGDITAVSGIGDRSFQAISDRLTVAPSAEAAPLIIGESSDQADEGGVLPEAGAEGGLSAEIEPVSPEADLSEESLELEIEAVAPGESPAEEGLPLEEEAPAESTAFAPPGAEETAGEMPEEALPDAEQEPLEDDVVLELKEGPVEEESAAEEPAAEDLPLGSLGPPAEATPSPSCWRRLSWLWAALLGGVLGMIFAMIVWAGINGSLDVAHSRAVLDIRGDVNSVATDVATLGTNIEGLRTRLDALEGLTTRIETVEASVSDLQQQTSALNERADALQEDLVVVSEQLQTISEDIASLQDQADQAQTFFSGLQALLRDTFGAVEEMAAPTPTPTPEGK